jgi:regulation of enolase protein 1 (concanavalin A-like superfamily)
MTATLPAYRSALDVPGPSPWRVLRAEWTKFRTVRGWLVATVAAAVAMVLLGWVTAASSHSTFNSGPGTPDVVGHPYVPTGPGGEAVTDSFTFVHRSLDGDGSITARVRSVTGAELSPTGEHRRSRLDPWSKAGLIVKVTTAQGSAYAAIMVTGGHGVRMQYDYTGDVAGPPAAHWLRLVRHGDTVTGLSSTDGRHWTTVGTASLPGLPHDVPAGLFATSPATQTVVQHLGGGGRITGGASAAVATFGTVSRSGTRSAAGWHTDVVGSGGPGPHPGGALGLRRTGRDLTVTGSGDIAPEVNGAGTSLERVLVGTFAGLTVIAVLAVLFMTSEYRRSMLRATLTTSPRRGVVLLAKCVVIGAVAFISGLVGALAAVLVSRPILVSNGNFVYPLTFGTQVRLIAGTAAALALTAVLALALGVVVRRSALAVAAVVVLIVLPYILATAAVLPVGPSQWLLRVTPAAAFAIQQTLPAYPQVDGPYTPAFGFFPLAPFAGLAVLGGYALCALALAYLALRRRDA